MYWILFSNPMMLPCVKTTSMYSLYSFSRARMMRSRVRISWLIGFSNAYNNAFRLDCNCYTCPRRPATSASRSPHTARTPKCSARTCRSYDRADYSSRPRPSFLESSASRSSLRWEAVAREALIWVFQRSRNWTRSERVAISMLSFLMNSVFSSRYLRISVLERSYLSMIFLDFSSFSFNSSAIFSKLSLSSSNFFLSVSTSFSFCCTFVRSTANFFSPSASWFFSDSTSGLVELDSMFLICRRTFFYSWRLMASCVFSASSRSSFRDRSCRVLVSRERSSVCWRRVVRISLQLSSLALSAFTSASAFRNCYSAFRSCSCPSRDSPPPPTPRTRSLTSSVVCCTLPSLPCTSLISPFISYRSSLIVNSSSPSPCVPLSAFRDTCSFTKADTASLLSAAISAIS